MDLAQPPERFYVGWGDLNQSQAEWVQQPGTWTLLLYAHSGIATINGRVHPFSPKQGIIFPPSATCGHAKVGPPSLCVSAVFSLPEPKGPRLVHAVPVAFEVLPGWYDLYLDACEHATVGAVRAKALAWHILWTIARPWSVMRDEPRLYEAEDIIATRLSQPLRVPEIARQLDVSQATLLAWFQAEHQMTVQGYIRQTRAREACRLLTSTNLRVKEIAAKVGVPDLQQFNKLVRNHSGLSPRDYRNKADSNS